MGATLPVGGGKIYLHMKGFELEEVAICDWAEGFTVPLHTKRPAESFLLLVKIAFALDTPGNVRALRYIYRGQWTW